VSRIHFVENSAYNKEFIALQGCSENRPCFFVDDVLPVRQVIVCHRRNFI